MSDQRAKNWKVVLDKHDPRMTIVLYKGEPVGYIQDLNININAGSPSKMVLKLEILGHDVDIESNLNDAKAE